MFKTLAQLEKEVNEGSAIVVCVNKTLKMMGESEFQVLAHTGSYGDWWFNMLREDGWADDEEIKVSNSNKARNELYEERKVYRVVGLNM